MGGRSRRCSCNIYDKQRTRLAARLHSLPQVRDLLMETLAGRDPCRHKLLVAGFVLTENPKKQWFPVAFFPVKKAQSGSPKDTHQQGMTLKSPQGKTPAGWFSLGSRPTANGFVGSRAEHPRTWTSAGCQMHSVSAGCQVDHSLLETTATSGFVRLPCPEEGQSFKAG